MFRGEGFPMAIFFSRISWEFQRNLREVPKRFKPRFRWSTKWFSEVSGVLQLSFRGFQGVPCVVSVGFREWFPGFLGCLKEVSKMVQRRFKTFQKVLEGFLVVFKRSRRISRLFLGVSEGSRWLQEIPGEFGSGFRRFQEAVQWDFREVLTAQPIQQ